MAKKSKKDKKKGKKGKEEAQVKQPAQMPKSFIKAYRKASERCNKRYLEMESAAIKVSTMSEPPTQDAKEWWAYFARCEKQMDNFVRKLEKLQDAAFELHSVVRADVEVE